MRLLHAFWLIDSTTHLVIVPLNIRFLIMPHLKNDLYSFAQVAQAYRIIWVLIAICLVLVLIPASADAEGKSSMAQNIYGTCHFCQQCRVAIAIAGDDLSDAHAFGIACECCRAGPALERHFLRGNWNSVKMIEEPD